MFDPKQRTNVATIIANPEIQRLEEAEVHSVVDALQGQGAIIEDVVWLAEGEAADVFFAVLDVDEARDVCFHLLEHVPFDFAVQKAEGRKKKLIVSDMDSTMINQECIDELADFAGLKEKISDITERAMNGELDFKEALRERVALLKGLSSNVLQEAYDKQITFMAGAKALVKTMARNDARTVLVSGGFTFFTERVAQELGFVEQEANVLNIADGVLDGTVKEPILDRVSKLNALNFHCDDMRIHLSESLVVGDGANDLDMICAASAAGGHGVAYHAKPAVRQKAFESQGVMIDSCDLTALLYIQGYHKKDFVNT